MRIASIGAALALAMNSASAQLDRAVLRMTSRAAPSVRARRMGKRPIAGRSKYMPHIGAKEQERAKRCWMSEYMESGEGILRFRSRRSAPTLCQLSRRAVDA